MKLSARGKLPQQCGGSSWMSILFTPLTILQTSQICPAGQGTISHIGPRKSTSPEENNYTRGEKRLPVMIIEIGLNDTASEIE